MPQEIYLDKSIPNNVRFLAVIQLKNGIDRYWRLYSQTKNGLQPAEKSLIRSRLFQGTIDEVERNLASHNALVVAKVIRIDYPGNWPDALPNIIALLRSSNEGNDKQLFGTLQLLLRVVKELGTARLGKSRTALQSVAPEIVYVLCQIYAAKTASWSSLSSQGHGVWNSGGEVAMNNSLLALRILRRLIIVGFETPHADSTIQQFWTLSQTHFGQFLSLTAEPSFETTYQDMVGKHLLQFAKLHIDMAEHHAASFCNLPSSIALVRAYWDLVSKFAATFETSGGIRHNDSDGTSAKVKLEGPLQEKLALKGLLLFRACARIAFQPVTTFKYRTPEIKAEQQKAKNVIQTELFQNDLVIQIVNTIITHLFVFRRADLELWDEDPEDWEQQEQSEGNAYEWEVRPCAEKLFLDLLTNFKPLLIPPLLSYFQTAQSPQADIAKKEAVYTAMGLAAAHVASEYDFHAVLSSAIAQDAQQKGDLYRVLRRRIAILISQWAPVKFMPESRALAYQIFDHFLNPNDETNDVVVQITAARQLRWLADELGFSEEAFEPYTANVLSRLIALVQTVYIDETKLAILESVRILVMRMEQHLSRFGDHLMAALPAIWESAGAEEYMIKQAVIAIFTALVSSLGELSQKYQHLMVDLLAEAARPGSDLHVHLIDESLELWDAILTYSKAPLAPEVIGLAHLVFPLLEYQPETASQALAIIDSYILIAPSAMLKDDLRRPLLASLTGILDARSREQVNNGVDCIEKLLKAATELGGSDGLTIMVQDTLNNGLMRRIIVDLHDAWEAHQTTGPNRKICRINPVTEGHYFAILARVAVAEPAMFVQMLSAYGGFEQVWPWLSSEWFSYLPSMDHAARQKLYLLALTRLLELPSPVQEIVLAKLQDYFDMWTFVLLDIHEGNVSQPDTFTQDTFETTAYDTPRYILEQQTLRKDPIFSVHAFPFVSSRLQDLVARVGGEAVFEEQWTVNVDKDVLERFRKMTHVD